MRNAAVRALTGGVLALGAPGLLGGCGLLGGDNSAQVCADTRKAFEQYITQVRSVAANKPEQWKQATEQLAGKVEGLSGQAENPELKKALKEEGGRLRGAATSVGTGDAAQLNTVITQTPQRIGRACA
ncbi:hypothetical protein [Actinomadura rugatobispora]|uniref:Small secreted protein n=1 Tax=Actinomadura rugatobispora TaxID=1994 RepID=A0ABW1AAP3_9ACTN|nr:hypothetical protein GCM10010200_020390 [Actinomadura rugatobispora]